MEREKKDVVIDAEVVDEGGSSRQSGSWNSQQTGRTGQGPIFTYFHMSGQGQQGSYRGGYQGIAESSVVPVVLFFCCLFQWGFLAALGFAFFCSIGSVLGFFRNMRMVMEGRMPNPWLWRIGNWVVSMALVAILSR